MTLTSLVQFRDELTRLTQPDAAAVQAARARDAVLTKPPGALGRLEELAIWLAGWQGLAKPGRNEIRDADRDREPERAEPRAGGILECEPCLPGLLAQCLRCFQST